MKSVKVLKRVLALALCVAIATTDITVTNASGTENTEIVMSTETTEAVESTETKPATEPETTEVKETEITESTESTEVTETTETTESTESAEGKENTETTEATESTETTETTESTEAVKGTEVVKGTKSTETVMDAENSDENLIAAYAAASMNASNENVTLSNTGNSDVKITVKHCDTNEHEIYASETIPITKNSTNSVYLKKATNWEVQEIKIDKGYISNGNIEVNSNATITVIYRAKEEEKIWDVTFFDYVVKPHDGWKNLYRNSINTGENYPSGSQKTNRFSVGTMDQNFNEWSIADAKRYNYQYDTVINNKHINVYTPGTGDNAKKTGIVTGLSGDYKNVLFSVDEPGVFSLDTKAGKTVLNGYKLSFDQKGDTYTLKSVYDPNNGKVADAGSSFFPLDKASSNTPDKGDSNNHNYFFGMRYDVEFTIGDYVGDLTYKFTGDDDLWVLVDGSIALDLGGIHEAMTGVVNIWDHLRLDRNSIKEDQKDERNQKHTLTVLYMERGGYASNCQMEFTLPNAKVININELTGGITLTKKAIDTDSVLANAEFTLTNDADQSEILTATSNDEGELSFDRLKVNAIYTLCETVAPEGYVVSSKKWKVKVTYDSTTGIVSTQLYESNGTTPVQDNVIYNDPASYNLTITKKIDSADFSYGDPVFTFKVTNTKTGTVYYRTVRFTKVSEVGYGETNGRTVTIEKLPAGEYTVEELGTMRYEADEPGKSRTVTITNIDAAVTFKNKLTKQDNFSDTDVVVNEYTHGENGWQVTKNKLSGTDKLKNAQIVENQNQ